MTSPAPPASPAARLLAALAFAAAIALAAWVLAYWFWQFTSTAEAPAVASRPPVTVDRDVIAIALGGAPGGGAVNAAAPDAAPFVLKGVVAALGRRPASAIVNTGGRDSTVMQGQEIMPGIRLAKVFPDAVEIERAGVLSRVPLEFRSAQRPGSASGKAAGVAPRGSFTLNVRQSAGNQFAFSRRELDNSLKDPQSVQFTGRVGSAPGGGARIDDAPSGSLADRLGLQKGDVIRAINGQSIASPGDLARLYQQFGSLSRIEAEVQRGAGVIRLTYSIQ